MEILKQLLAPEQLESLVSWFVNVCAVNVNIWNDILITKPTEILIPTWFLI